MEPISVRIKSILNRIFYLFILDVEVWTTRYKWIDHEALANRLARIKSETFNDGNSTEQEAQSSS
jgi:hypothetical protein